MSAAPTVTRAQVPDPVEIPDQAYADWLEGLGLRARIVELIAAARRDYAELIRQLPPGALSGVPARAAAEALEALLVAIALDVTP